QLSNAVRSSSWPAYVHLVIGDALECLGTLGSFNLVFADAAPVKYGNIESVIQVLCPGGVLLMDDFALNTEATKEKLLEKESLRGAYSLSNFKGCALLRQRFPGLGRHRLLIQQ